ncbi:MAG: PilZ domain-containing protein [Thalassobaculaceae bacterium]|nr:PilZ domain-containing protein [Thalassobaculaceae bacterium]
MTSSPSDPDLPAGEPPHEERRHANRVQIEGYEFEIGDITYAVVDLSLGGMRITYDDGTAAAAPGDDLIGILTGGLSKPIPLTAQVIWTDPQTRYIGCTFPVLGRNIAGELLEILL